jgi:YidC/Oxa1 family membrane protein insertase
MDNDFRRVLTAMLVALGLFLAYQFIINRIYPPRPHAPAPAATTPVAAPAPPTSSGPTASGPAALSVPATTNASGPAAAFTLAAGDELGGLTLGGRDGDALKVELTPQGAALSSLYLFAKNAKGRFVHRQGVHDDNPYPLLSPITEGGADYYSFDTYRVWIKEYNRNWLLGDLLWQIGAHDAEAATFTTALRDENGRDVLRFRKTYRLRDKQPVFDLELSVENASGTPLTVWVDQDGPTGVPAEGMQYDLRQVLVAQRRNGSTELKGLSHDALLKPAQSGAEAPALLVPDKGPVVWTAAANKYFGVFTHPVPVSGSLENYIAAITGVVSTTAGEHKGDLVARLVTKAVVLPPDGQARYPFEVYAGPKDATYLQKIDPRYADSMALYFNLAQSADRRCACTFQWLQDLMVWLLEKIFFFVRNYGVAIMILVVIVRTLLHPLSVWQQKSMFRMQEAMAKIQPKINEIKERFANDKVRLNQETMKLFAEENVNPAANFVSFIPMFIQMPILVALWTALNIDVNLRHAPFDGWWITDLSAPDAFIQFDSPRSVPILGDLPLVGALFRNYASINILPILMGVSMWLQQKYMPKPQHVQAKLDAARKPATATGRAGMTPEEQLRQQQIMSYMMAVMFPLMFYSMPSGLNLYWMATNVYGIIESLIIRKQINEEKRKRELAGPVAPRPRKGPGLIARLLQNMASQAEVLQRKADELSRAEESKRKDDKKKP